MRIIEKVTALIVHDKKLLVVREKESKSFSPIMGRIEENETFYGAVRREIQEKLGVKAKKAIQYATMSINQDENQTIALSCYLAELESTRLFPNNGVEQIEWIDSKSKKPLTEIALKHLIPKLKKEKIIS